MKAELYKKYLVWRVRLVGKNGLVVMNSEAYYNKSNATRALKRVKKELR